MILLKEIGKYLILSGLLLLNGLELQVNQIGSRLILSKQLILVNERKMEIESKAWEIESR